MKYLLWIGLILILLWLFRSTTNRQGRQAKPPAAREPEEMVRCAHCGVYLPKGESIRDNGIHYCCAEHRHIAQSAKH